MNYLKKLLGFKADVEDRLKNFKTTGTLYIVHKQTRTPKSHFSQVAFLKKKERWYMRFTSEKEQVCEEFIHADMDPVVFPINIDGDEKICFEWYSEGKKEVAGCYIDPPHKKGFKDMLCSILKEMKRTAIDQNDEYCKQLTKDTLDQIGDCSYQSYEISRNNGYQSNKFNQMLLLQKQHIHSKIVELCNLYSVIENEKKLVLQNAIFVLKAFPKFKYAIQIVCADGTNFLTKAIEYGHNFQINPDQAYIRWIDLEKEYNILEAKFYNNNDFVLSLKENMAEIMGKLNQNWLDEILSEKQLSYGIKLGHSQIVKNQIKNGMVQVYEEKKPIKQNWAKTIFLDKESSHQTKPYQTFYQAKTNNFSIAASGSLIEKFRINEDDQLEFEHKQTILNKSAQEIEVGSLLFNDNDTKAMVKSRNGRLYYQDLVKGKIIQQYDPCPKTGITTLCYSVKAAQTIQTFKALSKNSIYEIDIRAKHGIGNLKQYAGNPYFTAISPALDGNFVTGSHNGEIRFFEQVGKNANNKLASTSEPVTHLDTTKDGKWVLATFRKYLRLIPSQNISQISLYKKKLLIQKRPTPIQLEIPIQSLKEYGIKEFSLLPAKFDQSKQRVQKWIVSGFDRYTVVWELSSVIKGHKGCLISKNQVKVLQAEFLYNNPTKMMISTSSGIAIKQTNRKN